MTTAHRTPRRRCAGALTAALAAGLALAAPAPTLAVTPMTAADVERLVPRIEPYIEQSMAAWQVPGLAIGIVADDRLVYARGFGVRRHGGDAPVTPRTVFQFGSATKALLGATLAMLVDDGRLEWSDKVIDHYPDFRLRDPWVTREFEIADLLAQRSGLPAYALTDMMTYGYPREAIIRALRHVEPETSFRSTYAYQNAFHLVAGEIVARVGEAESWEAFLEHRLLAPLGMKASSNTVAAYAAAAERADGHRLENGTVVVDPPGPFVDSAGGAGNLSTTVEDASRWLRLQINAGEFEGRRVISAEALAATRVPRIAVTGPHAALVHFSPADTAAYATGWAVHATPQGRIVEHSGGTTGHNTNAAFDPDRRVGVVILANLSVDFGAGLATPLAKYVMDLVQGREPADHAAAMLRQLTEALDQKADRAPGESLPHRALPAYAGVYASPTFGRIEITPRGEDRLGFSLGPAGASAELTPWSGDVFAMALTVPADGPGAMVVRGRIRFLAGDDGTITGLVWPDAADGGAQPPWRRVHDEN